MAGSEGLDSPWGVLVPDGYGSWAPSDPIAVGELGELALRFRSEGRPPTQEQFGLLRAFLALSGSLKERIGEAVYAYYQGVCESYRDAYDEDFVDQDVPLLSEASQIWSLIDLRTLQVDDASIEEPGVVLFGRSTWDGEHGLGVGVVDAAVVDVGQAGDFL